MQGEVAMDGGRKDTKSTVKEHDHKEDKESYEGKLQAGSYLVQRETS